jgi:lipopolysaccharide cholinephosphotransferase
MTSQVGGGEPTRTINSPEALQTQLRDMLQAVADVLEKRDHPYFLACGTALGAVRHGDLIPWDYDVDVLVPWDGYQELVRSLRDELPARYATKNPITDTDYELPFARVHLASVHHKYAHVDLFPLGGTFRRPWAQRRHLKILKLLGHSLYVRTRLMTDGHLLRRPRATTAMARAALRPIPRRFLLGAIERIASLRDADRATHLANLTTGYFEREAMPRRMFEEAAFARIGRRAYPVPAPPEEYLSRLFGDFMTPPPEEERLKFAALFESWYLPALGEVALEVEDSS